MGIRQSFCMADITSDEQPLKVDARVMTSSTVSTVNEDDIPHPKEQDVTLVIPSNDSINSSSENTANPVDISVDQNDDDQIDDHDVMDELTILDHECSHQLTSNDMHLHPLLIQSPSYSRAIYTSTTSPFTRHNLLFHPMDYQRLSALYDAIQNNAYSEIQSICRECPYLVVNSRFQDQSTPLHIAVMKKDLIMVQLLLNLGANPMMEDNMGKTPIQWANELVEYDIIETLLNFEPSTRISSSTNTICDISSSASTLPVYGSEIQRSDQAINHADQNIHIGRNNSWMSQLTISIDLNDDDNNNSHDNNNNNTNNNGLGSLTSMGDPRSLSISFSPRLSDIDLDMASYPYHSNRMGRRLRKFFEFGSPRKPKGVNRVVRKAASRMMSYVAPHQYPKSRRSSLK